MTTSSDDVEAALKKLRLIGCLAHLGEIKDEPWLADLIRIESEERARRSLENRTRIAGLGTFKPMCDFDWKWPKKIDRGQIEDIFTNRYITEGEIPAFKLGNRWKLRKTILDRWMERKMSQAHARRR